MDILPDVEQMDILPDVEQMAEAIEEELVKCKFGFRARNQAHDRSIRREQC